MSSVVPKSYQNEDSQPASRSAEPAILVINPGSTSTKLSLYRGKVETVSSEILWNLPGGLRGKEVEAEVDRYVAQINQFLISSNITPDAVVGRGGFIHCAHRPLRSGVYQVAVVKDGKAQVCRDIYRGVTENPELDHASNYGIPVASRIALTYNIPAFTVARSWWTTCRSWRGFPVTPRSSAAASPTS
jgi:butyrate kinase